MTDESLILDVDIYMEKLEQAGKREQQLQETVARQERLLEQLRQELADLKSQQSR